MGIFADSQEYDRTLRNEQYERFCDNPAFNEEIGVVKVPSVSICNACVESSKMETLGAPITAKTLRDHFCECKK